MLFPNAIDTPIYTAAIPLTCVAVAPLYKSTLVAIDKMRSITGVSAKKNNPSLFLLKRYLVTRPNPITIQKQTSLAIANHAIKLKKAPHTENSSPLSTHD